MAAVNLEIDPDKDPSVYIFDVFFDCKARAVDLESEQNIKDFGHFHTGMEMMDEANMTQLVPCCMSVAQIATHMDKGFHIRFVHPGDVLKMFEYTQNHLARWAAMLGNQSLNAANAPVEDLIKLDRFCSIIYEQAKYYDTPKLTSIEQRFGTEMSFAAIRNMFGGARQDARTRLETLSTKHRKGFAELFMEHQMRSDPSMNRDFGLDIFGRGLNDRK